MLLSFLREEHIGCLHCVLSDLLHLGENCFIEVMLLVSRPFKLLVQVPLKLSIGEFVGFFKLPIILWVLLNGIVGEVGVEIFTVLYIVLKWGCSNIALIEPIAFEFAIDTGHEHEVTDIKLSSIVEEGFFNVFLKNEGMQFTIFTPFFPFQSDLHIVQWGADVDSFASVGELTWFKDPDVHEFFLLLL